MPNDNRPTTEAQTLRELANLVVHALPPGWSSEVEMEPRGKGTWRPDAFLRIGSPEGENARFIVETKRIRNPASLLGALDQLRSYIENSDDQGAEPLIFSPFLSPRSKDLLEEQGVSYIDTTGNVRLMARRPGLFVYTAGATKDPWPDDRPLQSLRGRGAARSVRALVDYRSPYGVRELAGRAGVPAATLSRVIELLARDALLPGTTRVASPTSTGPAQSVDGVRTMNSVDRTGPLLFLTRAALVESLRNSVKLGCATRPRPRWPLNASRRLPHARSLGSTLTTSRRQRNFSNSGQPMLARTSS